MSMPSLSGRLFSPGLRAGLPLFERFALGFLPSLEFIESLVFFDREHLTIWLKCTVIFFVAYVAPAAVNFFCIYTFKNLCVLCAYIALFAVLKN